MRIIAKLCVVVPGLHLGQAMNVRPRCCSVGTQLHIEVTPMPINRVDSMEMLKGPAPDTPGRGVGRRGSLYRVNSIIDGTEMEVRTVGCSGDFGRSYIKWR